MPKHPNPSPVNREPSTLNHPPSPVLHLCDFDGTLTYGDSFSRFLWFALSLPVLIWGGFRLLFVYIGLIIKGKWSNELAKAAVFAVFFRGKSETDLRAIGQAFVQQKVPSILRPELLSRLQVAEAQGETVVIVSASSDLWLQPFCQEYGFGLLCTQLEFVAGKYTGRFATPNCKGEEKVRRIKETYDLSAFGKIIAYGNSAGDHAMYELADEVFRF